MPIACQAQNERKVKKVLDGWDRAIADAKERIKSLHFQSRSLRNTRKRVSLGRVTSQPHELLATHFPALPKTTIACRAWPPYSTLPRDLKLSFLTQGRPTSAGTNPLRETGLSVHELIHRFFLSGCKRPSACRWHHGVFSLPKIEPSSQGHPPLCPVGSAFTGLSCMDTTKRGRVVLTDSFIRV